MAWLSFQLGFWLEFVVGARFPLWKSCLHLYLLEFCLAFGDVFLYLLKSSSALGKVSSISLSPFWRGCFRQMALTHLIFVLHQILASLWNLEALLLTWRCCLWRFFGFWPKWLCFGPQYGPCRLYGHWIQLASLWEHKLPILLISNFVLLRAGICICWSQGCGGVGRLVRPVSVSLWDWYCSWVHE